MDKILLIMLVIFAIVTVQTQKLRLSVIYMAVFSIIVSLLYFIYNAPDVAIAEIIVGSSISTILYIVALQRYNIFKVYFLFDENKSAKHTKNSEKSSLLEKINDFCVKQELEPIIIYTNNSVEDLIIESNYELIIECNDYNSRIKQFTIWGHPENYKLSALTDYLEKWQPQTIKFNYVQVVEDYNEEH